MWINVQPALEQSRQALRAPCLYCGAEADVTTTCPRAVECPDCGAKPGSPCVRPSGHRADELHKARVKLAEDQPPKETS